MHPTAKVSKADSDFKIFPFTFLDKATLMKMAILNILIKYINAYYRNHSILEPSVFH